MPNARARRDRWPQQQVQVASATRVPRGEARFRRSPGRLSGTLWRWGATSPDFSRLRNPVSRRRDAGPASLADSLRSPVRPRGGEHRGMLAAAGVARGLGQTTPAAYKTTTPAAYKQGTCPLRGGVQTPWTPSTAPAHYRFPTGDKTGEGQTTVRGQNGPKARNGTATMRGASQTTTRPQDGRRQPGTKRDEAGRRPEHETQNGTTTQRPRSGECRGASRGMPSEARLISMGCAGWSVADPTGLPAGIQPSPPHGAG